ncbi:leucine-rich repeat-containing protein 45-like [Mya arenaria]|uniref:leucine-rich repeat-containing protein 45-like n=1 Tax=Mya arenaria TaxID=6604 RepID=UPI0022E2C388|nr:leucine-rich repeat-containing protein 45-like [Mya arenaria]
MCALRTPLAKQADVLAQQYRLNMEPRRDTHRLVKRASRPLADTAPEIIMEVTDSVKSTSLSESYSDLSFRKSSTFDLDEEFDFDEDENDYFFDDFSSGETQVDNVVQIYEAACKKYNLLCMNSIKAALLSETFSCKFVKIQEHDLMALCLALYDNRYVHRVELERNGLEGMSIHTLGEVLRDSAFITHIRIVDNGLKTEGAKNICKAVAANKMIVSLDLSGNGFVESDGVIFEKLLNDSKSLRELILSKNALMDIGVKAIAIGLEDSSTLRTLDLSWNHIRLQGAEAIGLALERNISLRSVNLAWNGLHYDGARSIAAALTKNETLQDLDLACNRLNEKCIAEILNGLDNNSTLEKLRLANNSITCTGAEAILKKILSYKDTALNYIDLGKQDVYDTFLDINARAKKERGIEVVFGNVWDTTRNLKKTAEDDDEGFLLTCNPLTVLMECMRLQNLRLIDFFQSLDKDRSNSIELIEFCDGLLKLGVPVKRQVLLKLIRKLDKDKSNTLDFGEMTEAQNMHRKKLRQSLQVDVDFDRTEIGKVSAALRRILARNFLMKEKDSRAKIARKKKNRDAKTPSPNNWEEVESNMALVSPGSSRASSAVAKHKRGP